jgi:hypothetical protein
MTSDSLIRETLRATGTVSPRPWVGRMTLQFWKCRSANEKVQRFTIEASKILEFDDIDSSPSAFTIGDE